MTLLPNLNAKDEGFRKAFQDVRVRRALSLGIDRDEINEAIFFGWPAIARIRSCLPARSYR